eukprot:3268173-Prymnesium_polylepis.1
MADKSRFTYSALTPEEQEVLMRLFDQMDRNGGGSVSTKEIGRFFSNNMKREMKEVELEDILSEIQGSEGTAGFDFARFCELMLPLLRLKKEDQAAA